MFRGSTLLLMTMVTSAVGAVVAPAKSEIMTPRSGRIRLFDGQTMNGFYTWLVDTRYADPRGVFSVTNGTIRISGDGLGYLATRAQYRDYHLLVEFKWGQLNWPWGDRVGKARDSGLFLHATGPDGNSHDGRGAFMAAIECNIFQGATGDFLLIRGTNSAGELIAPRVTVEVADGRDGDNWPFWHRGGKPLTIERWGRINHLGKDPQWHDRIDFRGRNDVENLAGDWNRLECICRGDTIVVRLNGTVLNEAAGVFPQAGRILLQCEGSEIYFRTVDLLPLTSDQK